MLTNIARAELYRVSKTWPLLALGVAVHVIDTVRRTLERIRHNMLYVDEEGHIAIGAWVDPEPFYVYEFIIPSIFIVGALACLFVLSNFRGRFFGNLLAGERSREAYVLLCLLGSSTLLAVFFALGWATSEAVVRLSGYGLLPVPGAKMALWFAQMFLAAEACLSAAMMTSFLTRSVLLAFLALVASVYYSISHWTAVALALLGVVRHGFYFTNAPGYLINSFATGPADGWTWLIVSLTICAVCWTASVLAMRRKALA